MASTYHRELAPPPYDEGIAVQMGQALDKEAVVAVAESMDVEWIDEEELGVEEAAKKTTKFVTEEDLDSLVGASSASLTPALESTTRLSSKLDWDKRT